MKSIRLGLLAVLALLTSVSAHAVSGPFPVQALVSFNPGLITVQVQNNFGLPVQCEGRVTATTIRGFTGVSGFLIGPIHPGMWGYAYVNTSWADPFVNGWAQAWCVSY